MEHDAFLYHTYRSEYDQVWGKQRPAKGRAFVPIFAPNLLPNAGQHNVPTYAVGLQLGQWACAQNKPTDTLHEGRITRKLKYIHVLDVKNVPYISTFIAP